MSFLDWLGRVGAGLGAAGRDITGQMFGRLGPNDPSTFSGRMGNIAANNANPMALMQTGQAFMEGFRGTPGPARDLTGAAGRVSDAAAQRVGSVVGRGFIGRSGRGALVAGPGQARYVEPRNALGYALGQAPGVPGNWSVATAGRGTGAVPVSREGGPIMRAPTQAEIDALAAGGGSSGRQRASSQLGMTQLGQGSSELVMAGDTHYRNRGGMMQEY